MKFTVKTFIQSLLGTYKDVCFIRDKTMRAEPHIKWEGNYLYIFHPTEWPLEDSQYFDSVPLVKKGKRFYLSIQAENYWNFCFEFESGNTLIKNKIYKVSDFYKII